MTTARTELVGPGGVEPETTVVAGGPVLVRGAACVRDEDGVEHPAERPVVAVCACGLSQRAPWCDGTHKVAQNVVQKVVQKAVQKGPRR